MGIPCCGVPVIVPELNHKGGRAFWRVKTLVLEIKTLIFGDKKILFLEIKNLSV